MEPLNHMDEKELFCRIAKGEEDAFARLFHLYKQRFYGAALKITRSEAVATDTVQEVFINIWSYKSNLPTVQHPEQYLFAVVYNVINKHFKDVIRDKELQRDILEQQGSATVSSSEELFIFKEHERALHLALEQLPQQQKLIYQLSKQEQLSRNEIAAKLQVSPHTVKNHLLKAIRSLRNYLSSYKP